MIFVPLYCITKLQIQPIDAIFVLKIICYFRRHVLQNLLSAPSNIYNSNLSLKQYVTFFAIRESVHNITSVPTQRTSSLFRLQKCTKGYDVSRSCHIKLCRGLQQNCVHFGDSISSALKQVNGIFRLAFTIFCLTSTPSV